jgi:small subunit ribosomal protein S4
VARYTGPKLKLSRREGTDLFLKSSRRAFDSKAKADSKPGQHGRISGARQSDYGTQLREKQKLKRMYGVLERQFRRYYQEAARRKGDTGEQLVGLLERRLDTIVYRLKFVPTPFAARQFVSHGHVLVNGKRVTIPSYLVKEGDTVELKGKAKELPVVLESVESPERDVPGYLEVDTKAKKGRLVRVPQLSDVPYPVRMEPNLVVEFYSR